MTLPPQALEALSWTRVKDHLQRDPRLLLAVGALDQAGPHLPLGSNLHITRAVVDEVARRTNILRAPAFAYGVNLKGADKFAGTATLSRKTLHRSINELLACWEDHGVQELILVTSHPSEDHVEALLMALTTRARTTVFDLSAIPVVDLVEGEAALEHGGELTTSLLLHLVPELVDRSAVRDVPPDPRAEKRYRRGHYVSPPLESGGLHGYPSRASAQTGARIFQRYVTGLSTLLSEPGAQAAEPAAGTTD